MELTAEQDTLFRELCAEIKPGEYGRVEVSFIGHPSNLVKIKVEKTAQFNSQKPTLDAPQAYRPLLRKTGHRP